MDTDESIDVNSSILSFLSVYIVDDLHTSVRLCTYDSDRHAIKTWELDMWARLEKRTFATKENPATRAGPVSFFSHKYD